MSAIDTIARDPAPRQGFAEKLLRGAGLKLLAAAAYIEQRRNARRDRRILDWMSEQQLTEIGLERWNGLVKPTLRS